MAVFLFRSSLVSLKGCGWVVSGGTMAHGSNGEIMIVVKGLLGRGGYKGNAEMPAEQNSVGGGVKCEAKRR